MDAGQCVADPDVNNYVIIATSDDLAEGNQMTGGAAGGGCGSYSFYGEYTSDADTVTFSDTNGIAVPHFEVRIMFWAILIDKWRGDDFARVVFNDGVNT